MRVHFTPSHCPRVRSPDLEICIMMQSSIKCRTLSVQMQVKQVTWVMYMGPWVMWVIWVMWTKEQVILSKIGHGASRFSYIWLRVYWSGYGIMRPVGFKRSCTWSHREYISQNCIFCKFNVSFVGMKAKTSLDFILGSSLDCLMWYLLHICGILVRAQDIFCGMMMYEAGMTWYDRSGCTICYLSCICWGSGIFNVKIKMKQFLKGCIY